MQNRIDSLTLEKENLRYEINCLKEQIAQLKKLAFGSRTEKTKKILGEVEEINLFDEAEVEAKGSAPEPVIEVPAHHYRESFQCLECRKKEHFSIEKPQMPQPVLAKSIASPSSVAHVIAQKYQFSMPLYRQEQEWKSIGIALSRATLAGRNPAQGVA